MNILILLGSGIVYVGLLFGIAHYAEARKRAGHSLVHNAYAYSLSLAVYCTAWTYYGSVGRAAVNGIGFLPIYLGPTIVAVLWWPVLRKMIVISKEQRIASVADFISSRYGKSVTLGAVVAVLAVLAIIPYISIQLKAVSSSILVLLEGNGASVKGQGGSPIYADPAFYLSVCMAAFTILFGTRNLDPNERHEGLVAAIVFESLFKLTVFLIVGAFVTYGLYGGFSDLFERARHLPVASLDLEGMGFDAGNWFWLTLVSMGAILFLPRQFHVAVVENTNPQFVSKAAWLFPLYLLLINVFVLPIAWGGLLWFPDGSVDPDTFVLALPLAAGHPYLALLVALGGFAAATSMVIVAVIALSIMIGNNIVLPTLLSSRTMHDRSVSDLYERLLAIRRLSIILVLLWAYGYYKVVGVDYALVSIGLISFVGVAQFAPAALLGMYWKEGNKRGALWGLVVGGVVWLYTLALPTLSEVGVMSASFIAHGPFGITWLRPHALFGLEGMDQLSHAAFWSLSLNVAIYGTVSLYTRQSPRELVQADLFVNVYKYSGGAAEYEVLRREAKTSDLVMLLRRFLGEERASTALANFSRTAATPLHEHGTAGSEFVHYVETQLAGLIGAASAKVIINSVAKESPISLEEMFAVLEQTQEIMRYSRALEQKSRELEATTRQLQEANEQLQELDRLKADFITTVTHELRTPITSIRALANILSDHGNDLSAGQQREYLAIIVAESERITRLINQVLDIGKQEAATAPTPPMHPVGLREVIAQSVQGLGQLMRERGIQCDVHLPDTPLKVNGVPDQLVQVLINLVSNAIKFCPETGGRITVSLQRTGTEACLAVQDNGVGIAPKDHRLIFEKFAQVSDAARGKPQGTGLGLPISRGIVEQHGGRMEVESALGEGATFRVYLPLMEHL